MVTFPLLMVLVSLGALVGVMAGLLGIGGGLIIVPSLLYLLPHAGISPSLAMPMALATSLACIIITSSASAFNHIKLGNIERLAIVGLLPGVVLGGFLGTFVAELIPIQWLPKVFGAIVLCLGVQMLLFAQTAVEQTLPSAFKTGLCGMAIGLVSTLAGIGGGSLSVPFLSRHGVEMRKAVGSSSVCGGAIALSGMFGFVLHGMQAENLPALSLGYVYLPALFAIALTSIWTTRLGAVLATRVSTPHLKRFFAIFLMCVATTMLF